MIPERFWGDFHEVTQRIPLLLALNVLMFLQMYIATVALDESQQHQIRNLVDLGFATVGAYEALAWMLVFWAFQPVIEGVVVHLVTSHIRPRGEGS